MQQIINVANAQKQLLLDNNPNDCIVIATKVEDLEQNICDKLYVEYSALQWIPQEVIMNMFDTSELTVNEQIVVFYVKEKDIPDEFNGYISELKGVDIFRHTDSNMTNGIHLVGEEAVKLFEKLSR